MLRAIVPMKDLRRDFALKCLVIYGLDRFFVTLDVRSAGGHKATEPPPSSTVCSCSRATDFRV